MNTENLSRNPTAPHLIQAHRNLLINANTNSGSRLFTAPYSPGLASSQSTLLKTQFFTSLKPGTTSNLLTAYKQATPNNEFFNKLHKTLCDKTAEENMKIRDMLSKYELLNKTTDTFKKVNIFATVDTDIRSKLKEQASQIRLLLSKEAEIKNIITGKDEKVCVMPGKRFTARIKCKGQPMPFTFHADIRKGFGFSFICLSFTPEKLSRNQAEKSAKIIKSPTILSLKQRRGQSFSHDFIYILIECDRECRLIFRSGFGKGIFLRFC